VDDRGLVLVNATLQSVSQLDVFTAGDSAAVAPYPRAKAGVMAVCQGKPLARNLRPPWPASPPRPFVPQRKCLALISTGDQYAIASRDGWSFVGI
jgi:selenide,water dikinase